MERTLPFLPKAKKKGEKIITNSVNCQVVFDDSPCITIYLLIILSLCTKQTNKQKHVYIFHTVLIIYSKGGKKKKKRVEHCMVFEKKRLRKPAIM